MPYKVPQYVHMIGIGGIQMSSVAKLLVKQGVRVSGSDLEENEATTELRRKGIEIHIGHDKKNIPSETNLVIYTSACPEQNIERAEARHRNIRQITNFDFMGEWSEDHYTILICGTHGKSTTTALAGLMLIGGGLDPTVVVGSRVPSFEDGNFSFGSSNILLIEGDEYARHFLAFHPSVVVLNNIELDHTDVFPNLASLMDVFRELLTRIPEQGLVIANANDPNVQTLIGDERSRLEARGIEIKTFGFGSHADYQIMDVVSREGAQNVTLRDDQEIVSRFELRIPGRMNVMNAVAALALAHSRGVSLEIVRQVFSVFTGIWRRFECIGERNGITVISDYGHHPTAVHATLEAAKSFLLDRRIVLCFQPHHRNRTKHLFSDFVKCFDLADVLLLVEIYDVAGRDESADQDISSRVLQDAVIRHDSERGLKRVVDYAETPEDALQSVRRLARSGDVIIVMGAGDIYKIAKRIIE